MPKITKKLGNSKVSAWESRDFVLKKKKLCQNLNFDTAPFILLGRQYKIISWCSVS